MPDVTFCYNLLGLSRRSADVARTAVGQSLGDFDQDKPQDVKKV